jgi:protein Mpv17
MSTITIARVYRRSFEAHPHCTLAIAGGALTALGDVVAQWSQQIVRFTPRTYPIAFKRFVQITPEDKYRQEYRYDVARTLRFFLFGAGISKCPLHFCGARFP